ncbi:hypothetical protein [Neptunicella sp. SCSIO 80796]|uniref:hypothetical protein n=1 Tax=Neptunicella plasticusilytica TaxID=3117012 RepID=UPI003A4E119B
MNIRSVFTYVVVLMLGFIIRPSQAMENYQQQIRQLHQSWAEVTFQLQGQAQKDGFEQLRQVTGQLLQNNNDKAEVWLMSGLINASYSQVAGGLQLLKLAKAARHDLEKAIQIDDQAMHGMAYYCLANLYHQVPAWPFSFGSDKTAKRLFDKALQNNANDAAAHYYYAQFLYDNELFEQARLHFMLSKVHSADSIKIAEQSRLQLANQQLAKLDKDHAQK